MSLHRIIAPPPLALAVHPAPAPKTRKERKLEEEKRQAERELRHKKREEEKAKEKEREKKEHEEGKEQGGKETGDGEGKGDKGQEGDEVKDAKGENAVKDEVKAEGQAVKAQAEGKDAQEEDARDATDAKDTKDKNADTQAGDAVKGKGEEPKPSRPLVPIRLLAPAPAAPVHARIDLCSSAPYPPLPIDPRGAYHKYAKALGQTEDVYIDVTKDGWLAPIWKERTEREALARLTGEAERQHFRETLLAKEREMVGHKKVPESAQDLLLELWNALVEAHSQPFREVDVQTFWNRYDWTAEAAQKHLQVVPKEQNVRKVVKKDEAKGVEGAKGDGDVDESNKDVASKEGYQYPIEVEWTREGVEEVLSTVGITVGYNTAQPLPSRGFAPPSGLIIMTHGHFLLRLEDYVNYKPEGTTDKFEALVTTANDRVFGDMVVAQLNEEKKAKEKRYRARKEKEYRERKEMEAKMAAEKKKRKEETEAKGEKGEQEDPKGKEEGEKGKEKEPIAKVVKEGDEVLGVVPKDGGAVVAAPIEGNEAENRDEKHEAEGVIAAPAIVKDKNDAEAKDGKDGKDKAAEKKRADAKKDKEKSRPFDPVREAEMLAKMLGPEAANIPLADLKAAFAAMEAANAAQKVETAQAVDVADPTEPIIWMWSGHDGKCERWRWRNYAAGCGELEEGCWEERDWKVFADDAGCEQFEEEQQWMELGDVDVHDWSC